MRLLILITFLFLAVSCSNPAKEHLLSNVPEQSNVKPVEPKKIYKSNFNTKNNDFEPVPRSALIEFEPIFGKDIYLLHTHLFLSDKEKAKIRLKADIKNLTDLELKELSPELADGESSVVFVFRGKEQLALVQTLRNNSDGEVLIIYSTRDNEPIIKEVRSKNFPAEFLTQFAEKGKNDQIKLDEDISNRELDENRARKLVDAIRINFWIIQTSYGTS